MDKLRAEIERKRKHASEQFDKNKAKVGNTRFVRQSDIIEAAAEARAEAQKESDGAKRQHVTVEKANSATVECDKEVVDDETFSLLTEDEVKHRLRSLGQPITLFGETKGERLARMIKTQKEEVADDDFRLKGIGYDNRNDSGMKVSFSSSTDLTNLRGADVAADEDLDESYDKQDDDSESDNERSSPRKNKKSKEPSEYLNEAGVLVSNFSSNSSLTKEKVVYKYFHWVLKKWESDLAIREDAIKLTSKGKMETKTEKQCKDYIRPLFKMCKRKEVSGDILYKLFAMVQCCENGDFRTAHDYYIKTAIGNSAWPIGLTMVGIHERSGREKISTSNVAHVMNNELQRKYLTSVKRLMTYAQLQRPDVAPSMKVL